MWSTIGVVLLWAALPVAVSPLLPMILVLPVARRFGYELRGESGIVRYRGATVDARSPARVRAIARLLAPIGVLPWMVFFSAPLGVTMGVVGGVLYAVV